MIFHLNEEMSNKKDVFSEVWVHYNLIQNSLFRLFCS